MSDVALAEMTDDVNLDALDASLDELDDLEFELEAQDAEVETVVEEEAAEPVDDETIVEEPTEDITEEVATEVEAAEEAEAEVIDEVDAALAAADDLEDLALDPDDEAVIDRMEAYDSQEASSTDLDVDAAKKAKTTKPKKARAGGTRAPKKDVNAIDPEYFVLNTDTAPADLAQNKADVIAKRPIQVKIAEKFDNLFAAIASGAKPSRYTALAYEFLKSKGEITQKELNAHYEAQGVGPGTASSQSGQLMNLLVNVEIAVRDGKALKINPNSKVAERLDPILTA